MDLATQENLQNLVNVGEKLLKKTVTRMNLGTGICEPYHHTTNEMALKRFAAILHKEKIVRKLRSPNTNRRHFNQGKPINDPTTLPQTMPILSKTIDLSLPDLQELNPN
ncbi:hypothetical protein Hanom_Chr07g00606331 [Helianthus anomalus]